MQLGKNGRKHAIDNTQYDSNKQWPYRQYGIVRTFYIACFQTRYFFKGFITYYLNIHGPSVEAAFKVECVNFTHVVFAIEIVTLFDEVSQAKFNVLVTISYSLYVLLLKYKCKFNYISIFHYFHFQLLQRIKVSTTLKVYEKYIPHYDSNHRISPRGSSSSRSSSRPLRGFS